MTPEECQAYAEKLIAERQREKKERRRYQWRAFARRKREADPEGAREYERVKRARNPERARETDRVLYAANREKYTARAKAWRASNPEQSRSMSRRAHYRRKDVARAQKRMRKYGITPEQWDELFIRQGYKCAICSSSEPGATGKHWATDHCHKAGQIRGILCAKCNTGLGLFGDDIGRLRTAIGYLESTHAAQ